MANESYDHSHLDKKYFIDPYIYNCPFCNRRHVAYSPKGHAAFNWSAKKICHVNFVQCDSCEGVSMHLSFDDLRHLNKASGYRTDRFEEGIDIDSGIFYSVPTSFFAIDSRVPEIIRELITEAEGCLKMNYLTGASACTRKAIYELTVKENCKGEHYEDMIKDLKNKHSQLDPALIDVLANIQDMTSDKIHEQSWDEWDSNHLTLIIETLKSVLYEMYVEPQEKKGRVSRVQELLAKVKGGKEPKKESQAEEQKGHV